jgi:hypothetical protein
VLSNYTDNKFLQADTDGIKPDKFILKTSITPTQLVKLIQEQI